MVQPQDEKGRGGNEMNTYTISFAGTAYIEAETEQEASEAFKSQIDEISMFSQFEISDSVESE